MPSPERQNNLLLIRNKDTKETVGVKLNPRMFRFKALREMVEMQIGSIEPREIIIETQRNTTVVSPSELQKVKRGSEKDKMIFIYRTTSAIEKAQSATIRKPKQDNSSQSTFTSFIESLDELDEV